MKDIIRTISELIESYRYDHAIYVTEFDDLALAQEYYDRVRTDPGLGLERFLKTYFGTVL
ncbi:MAG: hypothetical protein GF392_06545 [Candidatus Omnitrophica bacterium]|nr:hypothetical protein [Candidatus Omnitrophota bacterium]